MKGSYTALCVVVSNEQFEKAKETIQKYSSLMDYTASYPLNENYQVVEIDMMAEEYTAQQLYAFAVKNIEGVCYRQEGSTIIVAKDGNDFKSVLSSCYTKEKRMYFLYDMLTISERYNLIMADPDAPSSGGGRLIYDREGTIYSLLLGPGCSYLFDEETEVRTEDDYTGVIADIDMINNIDIYDFHIRILGKNLEENTKKIL